MKLRNILIAAATMGVMFASSNRTDVVGYSAGDYSDMNTFPHKAYGQNVAFTSGGVDAEMPNSFNAVWTDGSATWGFAGGADNQLVDMLWSNGTYGVSFGLTMDSGTAADADNGVEEVSGETTMDIGFGMNLAGWDVGFGMSTAEDSDMEISARGNLGFWAFDTMTFDMLTGDDVSHMEVNLYGLKEWGAATGMFSMGFMSSDAFGGVNDFNTADAVTALTTGFSVESTLTDWCDLRIGYSKAFNVGAETGGVESIDNFSAGVGFNVGSNLVLDMTVSDATLNSMMANPLNYISGYNSSPLTTSWTLSYAW